MFHHRSSTYLLLLFHLHNARHCHISPSSRHTLVSRWKLRHPCTTFLFAAEHSRCRESVPSTRARYDPRHGHIWRWTLNRYRTHGLLNTHSRLVTSHTHLNIPEFYLSSLRTSLVLLFCELLTLIWKHTKFLDTGRRISPFSHQSLLRHISFRLLLHQPRPTIKQTELFLTLSYQSSIPLGIGDSSRLTRMLSTFDTIQSILSQFSPDSCSVRVQFHWIPLGTDDSSRETSILSSFGPILSQLSVDSFWFLCRFRWNSLTIGDFATETGILPWFAHIQSISPQFLLDSLSILWGFFVDSTGISLAPMVL